MQTRKRFWVYWNGTFSKLAIHPQDGVFLMYQLWSTDEGWSSQGEELWFDDDDILCSTVYTDGRDCDGRLSTEANYCCEPGQERYQTQVDRETGTFLTFWNGTYLEPIKTPRWERVSSHQRDYQAEAAGY